MYNWLDPRKLSGNMPYVVLVDDRRSFIGWSIKAHSSGNYGHAMILAWPGRCMSQNWNGFQEIDIDTYMKPGTFLKIWSKKGQTAGERDAIYANLARERKEPWYRKIYDFFGIVGQFVRIPAINSPWQRYCSERVAEEIDPWDINTGEHPDPSDLDRIFKDDPTMEVVGYWWED